MQDDVDSGLFFWRNAGVLEAPEKALLFLFPGGRLIDYDQCPAIMGEVGPCVVGVLHSVVKVGLCQFNSSAIVHDGFFAAEFIPEDPCVVIIGGCDGGG